MFTVTHQAYSGETIVVHVFYQSQIEPVAQDLFLAGQLGSITLHKAGVLCAVRDEHGPYNL